MGKTLAVFWGGFSSFAALASAAGFWGIRLFKSRRREEKFPETLRAGSRQVDFRAALHIALVENHLQVGNFVNLGGGVGHLAGDFQGAFYRNRRSYQQATVW